MSQELIDRIDAIQKIHEANPLTGVDSVITDLLEVCRDMVWEITYMKSTINRIKPESLYEEW